MAAEETLDKKEKYLQIESAFFSQGSGHERQGSYFH
jgi:hypothetical protein